MSSIKLTADSNGGTFELKAPASSSNTRVFTLPDSADATLLTSTASLGKVLQTKQIVKTDKTSIEVAAGSFGTTDSTFSISITPSSASNLIFISGYFHLSVDGGDQRGQFVYRRGGSTLSTAVNDSSTITPIGDASGNMTRATAAGISRNDGCHCFPLSIVDKPNTTSSVTYSLGVGHGSSITRYLRINSFSGETNHNYFARVSSVFIAQEVAP